MQIQVLKSKLKRVIVTGASVEYQGSLTLDIDLMCQANLVNYERVEVNSVKGKGRIITYVIPAPKGSGKVELNGGAANHFEVGEDIHVNCFASYDVSEDIPDPIVVETDEDNKLIL